MSAWFQRYWSVPVAVALALVSAAVLVLAIMDIGNFDLKDVRPWLLLAAAVVVAVLALIVQSFAPPGPNFVEKAAGIPGESVLMLIGIGLAGLGTAFLFDFGADDAKTPSAWWAVVVGIGVFALLLGVLRTAAPAPDIDEDPQLAVVRSAAARTKRAAEDAAMDAEAAAAQKDANPHAAQSAATLADRTKAAAADLPAILKEAENCARRLREARRQAEDLAENVESDRAEAGRALRRVQRAHEQQRVEPSVGRQPPDAAASDTPPTTEG